MECVKVNDTGQITLPQKMMERIGISNGSDVFLFETNGRIILQNSELEPVDVLEAYEKGDITLTEDEILDEVVKVCKQFRKEATIGVCN